MTTDTTAIIPSFLDDMELPDDLPGVQIEPARLNWYHGGEVGKTKAPGVFFGRDTAFTEPPPPPWEVDERYIDTDGPGYSAPRLRLTFVGERSQWFIPGKTDDDPIVWLPNGTRAPEGIKVKKQLEYLVLIDGLADAMVLSVSGFYKSRPIEQILQAYERGALAQLIRAQRRQLPRWSHWLTIGGKVDQRDQPLIEKAKDANGKEHGSDVTPPALLAAPVLVDKETFQAAIDAWNLYNSLGWFKYQRLPQNAVETTYYTITNTPQLSAPARNVPVPVENDEDLPF